MLSPLYSSSCRERKTSPPFRWSEFKPSLSEGICIATRSHSAIPSSNRVNTSWPECEYFSQSSLVFPPHFPIDFILSKPTILFLLRNIALKYVNVWLKYSPFQCEYPMFFRGPALSNASGSCERTNFSGISHPQPFLLCLRRGRSTWRARDD